MEFDRDLLIQVTLSAAVVLLFILALVWLGGAYGEDVTEDEPIEGTINGSVDGNVTEGNVSVGFDGTFSDGIDLEFDGTIEGEFDGEQLEGTFEGDSSGAIDGTANGSVHNGTVEDGSLDAVFEGNATGTTATALETTGGLVLVVIIVGFIVAMPAFGYAIERLRDDEE
jgi:hypothetical protein